MMNQTPSLWKSQVTCGLWNGSHLQNHCSNQFYDLGFPTIYSM